MHVETKDCFVCGGPAAPALILIEIPSSGGSPLIADEIEGYRCEAPDCGLETYSPQAVLDTLIRAMPSTQDPAFIAQLAASIRVAQQSLRPKL